MTWQLGSKPGVVDGIDRFGRPMAVPLPEPSVGELGVDYDVDDDPLAVFVGLQWAAVGLLLLGLGYIAGRLWP